MQARVTAVVVARNGAGWIDRTVEALRAQTRAPDALLLLDAGSSDGTAERLSALAPDRVLTARALSYPAAIEHALHQLRPTESPDEWIWLLKADTPPEPDALQRLLGAVEIAPSVAIAGPKLVDPDDPAMLRSFGESLSRRGTTVRLVEDELDQGQHDRDPDVLGVALEGSLVRRVVWQRLGGADPGLPTVDAGLDLSVRARLAGHRVARVPRARVGRASPPEDFGRRTPLRRGARRRIARTAELHRRLVYAPAIAVPFLWLGLGPLALLRSIGHLLAKRPLAIGPEIAATLAAAFDGRVPAARARLARARAVGWGALAPLRIPPDELRERRAAERERLAAGRPGGQDLVRASFLADGGIAVVVAAALAGVVLGWRLLGADALVGGQLRPLTTPLGQLWSGIGWGARDPLSLAAGPSDPFATVVAILGSLTAWAPSLAIVVLWIAAPGLAALGAWWAATRLSVRGTGPVVAAALWALAAPLLVALADGRPGAVIAHVLLPWLALAVIEATRSWSASGAAALLFAAVAACAPSLSPALLVLVVAAAVARPRGLVRLLGVPVLGAVLAAGLVVAQWRRGDPLGLFADPGPAAAFAPGAGWELLLARPAAGGDGWVALAASLGLPPAAGALAVAVLCAPVALLALLAVFLPRGGRAIPALLVALLGLGTAVAAAHLQLSVDGGVAVAVWPGAGLSLYWAGLLAAVVVGLDALPRAAVPLGAVAIATTVLAALPLGVGLLAADAPTVRPGGSELPALVVAEAASDPQLGTLVLSATPDGALAVRVERGAGTTLDGASTLATTRVGLTDDRAALAELAGNIASVGGYDPTAALDRFGIDYVLLAPGALDARQLAAEGLDASAQLERVGTSGSGDLWRVREPGPSPAAPTDPTRDLLLIVPGAVLAVFALLLAIPTGPRRRVVREQAALPGEDPADTFEEDEEP
ncbi:MAG: glycosyltransferase family 2 protein [Actinomycetales bacterium]|nr:glycosyltransferase family 2 protein [Actinomycetales bacterium]